jgi:cytidylate kinase
LRLQHHGLLSSSVALDGGVFGDVLRRKAHRQDSSRNNRAMEERLAAPRQMQKLTITIDGPAGSGKSTVARLVAALLGCTYLDSGAMYRALALKALRQNIPLGDDPGLQALAQRTNIELKPPTPEQEASGAKNRVFLDGNEVTEAIRTAEVAKAASLLAPIASVRKVLVAEQQRAGAGGGIVMEGRDIGTVVFPNADLKIFLDASPEVRAERRWKEHKEKGDKFTLAEVLVEVRERDQRDRERKVSPLVRATDAVLVDNTAMDAEETTRLIVMLARDRERELAKAAGRKW